MRDILDAAGVGVPPGWLLTYCNGITRNGDLLTICGTGTNPAGDDEAWVARVRVTRSDTPSTPTDAR